MPPTTEKKPPLTFLSLDNYHADGPTITLVTPGGLIRKVPLDRKALVNIIIAAGRALAHLDAKDSRS